MAQQVEGLHRWLLSRWGGNTHHPFQPPITPTTPRVCRRAAEQVEPTRRVCGGQPYARALCARLRARGRVRGVVGSWVHGPGAAIDTGSSGGRGCGRARSGKRLDPITIARFVASCDGRLLTASSVREAGIREDTSRRRAATRVRATGSEISGDRPWAHRSSPTSRRRSSRVRTSPTCPIRCGVIVGRWSNPCRCGALGPARPVSSRSTSSIAFHSRKPDASWKR